MDISYNRICIAYYAMEHVNEQSIRKVSSKMKSKKVVEFTFEYIFDDQMSKIGILPKQLLSNYLGNVI